MLVNGMHYRTVWMEGHTVFMIEQNLLPFEFKIFETPTCADTCQAIKTMIVRGAGAIGVAAAYAMAQAFQEAQKEKEIEIYIKEMRALIESTRPTARNLFYATERVFQAGIIKLPSITEAVKAAEIEAARVAQEDVDASRSIGEFGNKIIRDGFRIETHCNAGWLAFTDYGTALSPIYAAAAEGKNIFVYADETRPRSRGARLTAWELQNENIPHVIIPDNAGAFLMSQGKIDMMIVGADRIAANGDVANKIGTLEKAIVAKEFNVPFYVAAPLSTFDLNCTTGNEIPIENRSSEEVLYQTGPDKDGVMHEIRVCAPGSDALNPSFDVTPAKYITGIITEKGIISPCNKEILNLFEL